MYNAVTTSSNTTAFNDSQETKLTVAELLSSLANGDPVTSTQYSTGILTPTTLTSGIVSSLASGTTPLLTPSTLNSIEQIIELHNEPTVAADLTTQSGFVPPLVEPITTSVGGIPTMVKQEYQDYGYGASDAGREDPEWLPSAKRARTSAGVMVANAAQLNFNLPAVTPNATVTATGSRRPTGPRPQRPATNMTREEEERRGVRRERNKQAAAKCRQRRVDLTNTLINESEGLEEDQAKLEEEIQSLQAQKEQLEFLLEAHKPLCSRKCQTATSRASAPTAVSNSLGAAPGIKLEIPSSRPNTLPLKPRTSMAAIGHVAPVAGIPITTPSNGVSVFNFGLEAMMDGHTGLTPITGAPSCASEVQRTVSDSSSSPSEALSSPTTLMAL